MFFLRCLGVFMYDAIVLLTLFFAATALALIFHHNKAIPPGTLWYQGMLCAITFLYYYASLKYGGQTIGMRAWRFTFVPKLIQKAKK